MGAQELRIGNYVISNYGISEVFDINPSGLSIIFLEEVFYFDVEDYNPIPLTEEWFVKFRFNRLGYQYFELGNVRACTHEFGWLITFGGKNLLEIKYVHQLQNLFFCLTNKELTLCQ